MVQVFPRKLRRKILQQQLINWIFIYNIFVSTEKNLHEKNQYQKLLQGKASCIVGGCHTVQSQGYGNLVYLRQSIYQHQPLPQCFYLNRERHTVVINESFNTYCNFSNLANKLATNWIENHAPMNTKHMSTAHSYIYQTECILQCHQR